jgi:hypothetical protein
MNINFAALFQRVLELLTNPRKTWRVIRSETDSGRRLVTRYVLLLAVIPAVCSFLGVILFDSRMTFGDRFAFSLIGAALKLGIFVGSVFVLGMLTHAMAPSFDTAQSQNSSFKLAAYVSTPVCVAGFVTLVPQLTALAALAGFGYALYLFQLGAQELLKTPPEKAWAFSFAAVLTWFVLTLITTWIAIQIAGLMFAPRLLLGELGPASATFH